MLVGPARRLRQGQPVGAQGAAEIRAAFRAVLGLDITGLRLACGATARRQRQHVDLPGIPVPGDHESVASAHRLGRFRALAVAGDVPPRDRAGREPTRLVEAREEQPFVDAQAVGHQAPPVIMKASRSVLRATRFPTGECTLAQSFLKQLAARTEGLRDDGLYKRERPIAGPQQGSVRVAGREREVINLCANNYLGLANHPDVVAAAHRALDEYGYGMASVRFICGTQTIHTELERRISDFLGTEDTILYPSCFDANGGLFETILTAEDAVISDALNHASIIDGIRLSKAQRLRYAHNDMNDLRDKLVDANDARVRLIATDGVFSMDGTIADLPAIVDLARRYDALTFMDDCHATGFLGKTGRGTHEHHDLVGKIDVITGTLGKALGGASGGYTSGRREIIGWLRQRSRPYLFSNTLAPTIAAASIAVLDLIERDPSLCANLWRNTRHFRARMTELGFDLKPGNHPIIPVMLGDAKLATDMANALLDEGVYVVGFAFPVVPRGEARIRTQMSAAHSIEELDNAIDAFARVGERFGVIGRDAA